MEFRPTRRTVLALGGAAIVGSIAGCAGDSSSTTDAPTETTAERLTATEPSTEPMDQQPTPTPASTEPSPTTSPAPATTTAERTTETGETERLTVKGVEAPGSTSGQLTVNPPDTVSLVEFFATWCGPCKDQMSQLRRVRSEFSRDRVTFISITQENKPDAIREFWKEYDGTWRVGIDEKSEVTQKFDVRGYPTSVVLLPDGTVTARHVGSGPKGFASDIRRALKEAGL
jgi:thiol-disulfide isomerase/thioredoxin